uniref:Uncharacterized protein n=1 Tax=Lepeophtheirus salmonis TaxID=72036 RepID=A0A0K2TL15_LEPSM
MNECLMSINRRIKDKSFVLIIEDHYVVIPLMQRVISTLVKGNICEFNKRYRLHHSMRLSIHFLNCLGA